MDIDTSFTQELAIPTEDFSSPIPALAVPTIANFNALFYESQSPVRPVPSPSAPQLGKRRSLSPEAVCRTQPDKSSSPLPSSPSESKFQRIASGPLPGVRASKPMLEGLGFVNPSKRVRRPALSTMAYPQAQFAHSIPSNKGEQDSQAMPLARRAFSAMLPSNALIIADASIDENSSFESPDLSSPAQTYTRRQQTKTLRRCDGSDNLRPASHDTPAKPNSPGQAFNENSPSARWLMPGFGDNEAHGKILPCHRVKEDGLMRVTSKTVGLYVCRMKFDSLYSRLTICWMESTTTGSRPFISSIAVLITNTMADIFAGLSI
jgi:M-phase inducer tyrosine phosphatase